MTTAIYPGSFDPVTLGHIDVIRRAAKTFDTVYVCVSRNVHKHYLFSEEERMRLIEESVSAEGIENVEVACFEGLVTDFAKKVNATVIVKGLRDFADFEYESQMDYFNKRLAPEVETFYLMADKQYSVLSSSAIRELMAFDGDLSGLVPKPVIDAARDKQAAREKPQKQDFIQI